MALGVQRALRSYVPTLQAIALLAIGLGFLWGGVAAYDFIVERPNAWPKAEAVVVSSRVANPNEPKIYTPEIVFRIADVAGGRQVTSVANWSNGSYDTVRAYVDRYPPGTVVSLAINPANADDVRYELGLTMLNLIVPGGLAVLGLIFSMVGVAQLPARRRTRGAAKIRPYALIFGSVGALMVGIGAWILVGELSQPAFDWQMVDGNVVDTAVRESPINWTRRSLRAQLPGSRARTMFDLDVTFEYHVDGKSVTGRATAGEPTTSRSNIDARQAAYLTGSRHRLRYSPRDPNVIHLAAAPVRDPVLPAALVGLGAIFVAAGMFIWKKAPEM